MKQNLIDNGAVVVKNFLKKEEAADLHTQFKEMYANYPEQFGYDHQSPNSPAMLDPFIFVTLLLEKLPFVAEFMGEPVFPTYSYARHYKHGATLHKHTDRAACEITVSVNLGKDASWDLCFEKPDGEKVAVDLEPGEAAVYSGCTTMHWRDGGYKGQEYGQVFLHYVRAAGENRWAYFDKKKVSYGY
jgi:hypothetical protein